ncbi:unnamed protein product [marine sediment metagenome]|uniref:DprA winged helix domain-containing protein n=1 Tax=marine sediment metagenome TaxID=412755 RepID=X0US23_9ZZZZ
MAVTELRDLILSVLGGISQPMSLLQVHEVTKAASPFTVMCVLEALEEEGLVERKTAEGRSLWLVR